jgi:hypothetical protein
MRAQHTAHSQQSASCLDRPETARTVPRKPNFPKTHILFFLCETLSIAEDSRRLKKIAHALETM